MTLHSTTDPTSILEDGKLKPGIYKIQNLKCETFIDIITHAREVCCRPARDLGEGRGLWDIKRSGAGYTVQFVEPGKPQQFCTLTVGASMPQLIVAAYPVTWRLEVVDDPKHRGFEYIRFCWGITNYVWALQNASPENGTTLWVVPDDQRQRLAHRIWRLIPVKIEGSLSPSSEVLGSGPPSYDEGATGQSSVRTQVAESERDDFGTVVTEVTTVTTRKRYRVEDA